MGKGVDWSREIIYAIHIEGKKDVYGVMDEEASYLKAYGKETWFFRVRNIIAVLWKAVRSIHR